MSIIRKYNYQTKQWETISSNNAKAISVNSEKLVPNGQSETNVESVLNTFKDDIDTLKGNVSWLAEHGGGGSGSGGGSSTVDATITVNGLESGQDLVLTSDGLSIIIQSKQSSLKWNLVVTGDSKIIKSVNNVNKLTITTAELDSLKITKSFQLTISAFNEATLTNIYWNGQIKIASVDITTKAEVSLPWIDKDKYQIIYSYNVGILGTYQFRINGIDIGKPIVLTALSGELQVQVTEILDKLKYDVGQYTLKTVLYQVQDPDIASKECVSRMIVTADDPIISCPNLSSDSTKRTPIYISDGGTVLMLPYTVYYATGSFKVQCYSDISEKQSWDKITTFNYYNTTYPNFSYSITDTTAGINKDITIVILDSSSQKEFSATFYGVTTLPSYSLLDLKTDTVFNIQTKNIKLNNYKYSTDNVTLNIKNPNVKSQNILSSDNSSLRLQNASYAVISNNQNKSIYESYLNNTVVKEFSISISYRCDFHPDDDRIILQYAVLDNENTPTSGILLKDHVLYIGRNSVDLVDQELLSICITYKQITNKTLGSVFVYINGTCEKVFKDVDISSILPENEHNIYLAASNNADQFTDVSIYRVSLYSKCLNPLQCLYEYLNDQAYTHLVDNHPDPQYIEDGLRRNFITTDNNNNHTSLLYNSENFNNNASNYNEYFSFSNLVSVTANGAAISKDISNYIIPIPLLFIDVSDSSNWTWSNFITPNSGIKLVQNCHFEYYDQNSANSAIISGTCDVDLQGTSTLSDNIKNLSFSLKDDTVFIPKESWFPEQNYTLKADIVDSSHSLNCAIGKFVNEEFGLYQSNSSWYPYSETVKSSFIAEHNKTNSAIKKYFPKATLKHGVEGFPVFLIMRFKGESNNDAGLHSMGLYQFILGRKSPRNLGYEIINKVTGIDEDIKIPFYKEGVEITSKINKGYWIEFNHNDSFADDAHFQEMNLNEFTSSKQTGVFWQEDLGGNFYDEYAEIKYTNTGSEAVSKVTDFEPFKQFVRNIIHLPVTNRRQCETGESTLSRNTFRNTTYPIYKSVFDEKTKSFTWVKQEGNNIIYNSGDQLESIISGEQKQLDLDSYAQFFVIMMFFGLIDNFEKNMPLKFYQKEDKTWEVPLLGVYDTDSGIGFTNEAENTVTPYVWLSTLKNQYGILTESSDIISGKQTRIIGQNNKLWYFDSDAINYSYGTGSDTSGSLFSSKWYSMITFLKNKYDGTEYAINSLEDLVHLFYNKYFLPQTNGCGELLFDLTYFTKYLNEYTINGKTLNQAAKLHGRRQQQVKKWLINRVKFLDSMFSAMGDNSAFGTKKEFDSTNVSITSGSGPEFTIKANYPIISKSTHQGMGTAFHLLNDNTPIKINWGADAVTSQSVNHALTYSDALSQLGDEQGLNAITFVKVNSGSIPYLTDFNAFNCKAIGSDQNALKCFTLDGHSELRSINLSNTAKTNISGFNYTLILTEGFEKLQKLNLSNSCVTNILLPSGENSIPLLEFNITNSQLTRLDLEQQNLLTNIDLTGCSKLTEINITNCENLNTLTINETQSSLQKITINSETFTTLNCKNKNVTSITINSSRLTSVNVQDCVKLKSLSINGTSLKVLNCSNCQDLTYLNIAGSFNSEITTFNLSNTSLSTIYYNAQNTDTSVLDVSKLTNLQHFNIQGNGKVRFIQFKNDQANPFTINTSFANVSNLERVYGHIAINVSNCFINLRKFSIFGDEQAARSNWENSTMSPSNGSIVHFKQAGIMPDQLFQTGIKVTNMKFINSNGTSNFQNTACSLLDAYYVLYKPDSLVDVSRMFYGCSNINIKLSEDRRLSKYTFINCGNFTSIKELFRQTNSVVAIESPSHTSDGVITENDGLLSPLVNLNNFNLVFYGNTIYLDRFAFRRKSGSYKIQEISFLSPDIIVDDISQIKETPNTTYLLNNYETIGNLNNFFINLSNLTYLRGFIDSTQLINWKTTNNMACPAIVYQKSFIANYMTGDIELTNLFKNLNKVQYVQNSFIGYGGAYSSNIHKILDRTNYKISKAIISQMTALVEWGYVRSGDFRGSINLTPFTGAEITRSFEDTTFPIDIFAKMPNLKVIEGFFDNVQLGNLNTSEIVQLPNSMFINNKNLESVQGLFRNSKFNFSLTSEGFINCPKLQNVARLFEGCKLHFNGSIPYKFFYHGQQVISKTYTGANLLQSDGSYKYDPFEFTDDGGIIGIKPEDIKTVKVTYNSPYTTITNMEYCFSDCNIESYSNPNPEIENNSEYLPLTHLLIGDTPQKVTYNNLEKTIIWSYDGTTQPSNFIGENLDDPHDSNILPQIKFISDIDAVTGDLHYMCPPDLLRYCVNNSSINISYLFYNCGYDSNGNYTFVNPSYSETKSYGVHGRIVPYLLKPISNVTNLAYLFANCKLISYYTNSNLQYVIPISFFKYAVKVSNLSGTFSGMSYPQQVNLNVFSSLTSSLDITLCFAFSYFNGTSEQKVNIQGIFLNKSISELRRAFSCNDLDASINTMSNQLKTQYVIFDGIFTKNKINQGKDLYVFDGYKSGYVEFKNKSLRDSSATNNYRTS